MVSILTLVIAVIVSAFAGFIAGVFVYRNNAKQIGAIADKVDTIMDTLQDKEKG